MDGIFGIEIARKALQASQYGMDVTAHNIANANTPGYTRQRAILGTTEPFPAPYWNRPLISGQLGTGVEIKTIQRVRDRYFDNQIRKENQSLGSWEVKEHALQQLETIFNEPSETSLLNLMGEFWNGWQQLSKNPENVSVRTALIETARTLTTSFNQIDSKMVRLQENLNDQLAVKVSDINDITARISAINKDVLRVKVCGMEPNDLMDERDQLIDELSKMIDVQVMELDSGVVTMYLNGRQLISEYSYQKLQVVSNPLNNGYYDVRWVSDGSNVTLYGGEVKGLVDARDVIVQAYRNDLDTLVDTLVTEVNAVHQNGYGLDGTTGWSFFDPANTKASNMSLSSDIDDPNHVAAASTWVAPGNPGDNTNALSIAQLKDSLIMNGGTVTMNDYYRSVVTDLGVESQGASRMVANGKLYYNLIENHRQSVSGVSLDEEATNMIKYQRAYQAAARVITVFDDMLDVLINRMIR